MIQENRQILVNTRILTGHLAGAQRYLLSMLKHMPESLCQVRPRNPMHGIRGHAWEQFVLPIHLKDKLLWSPSGSGPLMVTKQVLTVHDLVPIDHPEFLNPRFAAWYQFLLPKLVHRVQRIIAISEFTKQRLINVFNVPEERICVIWNGVDERFCPQPEDRISSAIKRLGIPTYHYFVALGSLEPRKNLKRLLDAWTHIVEDLPDDIWLVLAGAKGKSMVFEGVPLDPLPPRVHLTGHVPDELLPALYAGAIAAPYLSVYEGFGLPPLEAMACGTPTFTGNRTALPEVVGNAAMTVDPYDVEAIAQGLYRLAKDENLRQRLRLDGLKQSSHFSWKNTAEKTWQVLKETAA